VLEYALWDMQIFLDGPDPLKKMRISQCAPSNRMYTFSHAVNAVVKTIYGVTSLLTASLDGLDAETYVEVLRRLWRHLFHDNSNIIIHQSKLFRRLTTTYDYRIEKMTRVSLVRKKGKKKVLCGFLFSSPTPRIIKTR
jgi:hypothetical protein